MKRFVIGTTMLLLSAAVQAQELKWFSPAAVEGICVPDTANIFHRLPMELKEQVRPIVWNLSRNTAGEFIRFRSTARSFTIKYGFSGENRDLPNMPVTGISGLDLYVKDRSGHWNWAPARYKFGDTCVYSYRNIGVNAGEMADFYLYLPLYNSVSWLSVGVGGEEEFMFVRDDRGKPVVAYGTSIMHGAVASRPGMAWTNILGRKLDRTVINLGFSGNGKYEKPIFDLMARTDAALYILDCMPNLTGEALKSPEQLEKHIVDGVASLRTAHPEVPVLFAEYPNGNIAYYTDTTLMNIRHRANLFLRQVFDHLQSSGVRNIFLLTEKEIGFDETSLTEATHPNNVGMLQYARAYEKKIKEITGKEFKQTFQRN